METSSNKLNNIHTFFSPHKLVFGIGSSSQVGKEAKNLGGTRALIITDKQVLSAGLIEEVTTSLRNLGLEVGIFDQVQAEPPPRNVNDGACIARDMGCDIVIGIGGGSSLDVAKGVALMVKLEGSVVDYAGNDVVPYSGVPKILLPTTAGTGAEVTRVFVVNDEEDKLKKVVYSDFVLADVAIVDPTLTLSMPPSVTVDTGMDALVHAIEAYVSVKATPFSDLLSIKAVELIGENLPTAYKEPDNIEARSNMSLAATMAGLAVASGGLGANHALAYVLGTDYHLSHGRSNAVLLPYIIDFNRLSSPQRYAEIARALGISIAGLSVDEGGKRLVEYLTKLLKLLGVSTHLSSYGVSRKDIPVMVEGAMKQSRLFVYNPRKVTTNNIKEIYTRAL